VEILVGVEVITWRGLLDGNRVGVIIGRDEVGAFVGRL